MARRHSVLWPNRLIKPPYGAVEIDWAHPLAQGNRSYWLFNEGGGDTIDDLGSSANPLTRNTVRPTWSGTSNGVGLAYDGTANQRARGVRPAGYVSASPRTFAIRFYYPALAGAFQALLSDDSAGQGDALFISAGEVPQVGVRGGASVKDISTTLSAGWYTIVITTPGWSSTSNWLAYVNGSPVSVATVSSTWTGSVATAPTIGAYYNNSYVLRATVLWAGVWSREISAAEGSMLHADPYCFLRPVAPVAYFDLGYVAGGAPPATSDGYMRMGKYWW